MKITSPWRRNKDTKHKKGFTQKPKINWQGLGLKNRKAAEPSLPIDEIRRRVIQASNLALGQSMPTHPAAEDMRPSDGDRPA